MFCVVFSYLHVMNTYYIQVPIRLQISVVCLFYHPSHENHKPEHLQKIAQLSSKCHMILDIIHVRSTNRAGLKLSCLSSRNILSYEVSVCVVCMCVFKQNVRWCNRFCSLVSILHFPLSSLFFYQYWSETRGQMSFCHVSGCLFMQQHVFCISQDSGEWYTS